MKQSALLLILLVIVSCNTNNNRKKLTEENIKIVIAHRGASGYLPEHTLEAKAMAYAMGADYLEQDLALSKDNIPIVIHDIHLGTVTNVAEKYPERAREDGKFYVIDFYFEELKTLSVYERFKAETDENVFPNRFPSKKSSFKLHSLSDEIEMIQGLNKSTGNNIGIYPEIKNPGFHKGEEKDISKIVLDILKDYGYTDKKHKCFVQCFDIEETKRIRNELKSNLNLIQLLDGDFSDSSFVETAKYADGIGPWFGTIIKGKDDKGQLIMTNLVKNAHKQGLLVHPFTYRADDFPEYYENFNELLEVGFFTANFDGVFTDFPDKAVEFLKNRKQ